MVQALK